jgi:flagellar hook-length control protein FliK
VPEPSPLAPQGTPAVPAGSSSAPVDLSATGEADAISFGDATPAAQPAIDTRAAAAALAEATAESASTEREPHAAARARETQGATRPVAFHLPVESSPEAPVADRRVPAASFAAFFQESAAVAAPREGALSFEFSGHAGDSPVLAAQVKSSSAAFATALANTPAFDALPSETTAQIVQAMRLQWARGGGEAHIKLEPHHFGDLKVSIKVEQGQVTARLEADVPVVREWLQSNQALLRTSLAEQNLTLDRLEVAEPRDPRDSDERQQQNKEERPKPQSSRRRRSETRDVFEVVA